MPLQVLTTGFIVLGLLLTVYCVVRLAVRYRVVARDLETYEGGLRSREEQDRSP